MFRNLPRRLVRALRSLLRLCVIAAIMMVIGWILEKTMTVGTFAHLTNVQREALAAVEGLNPWEIKDRFLCALHPSVESLNRHASVVRGFTVGVAPVESDCMYTLSRLPAVRAASQPNSSAGAQAALPPPVVRHWADRDSGWFVFIDAFMDTVWHLFVQPSVFASVFAILVLVLGGLAAAVLMALPRFTWHPYAGAVVYCAGSVVLACAIAWGLQLFMEGGLYVFGRVTQLAGLCCGSAGIALVGYNYAMKTVEVGIHEGVDRVIPH